MAPTFGDVLDAFLAKCEAKGLEPASLKSYRYFIEGFLRPALGVVEVAALTIGQLEAVYLDMSRKGYNPTTIRKCNVTAGGALKLAERNEWITRNPSRLAELPKTGEVKRIIPDPESLARFLDHARRADRTIHDFGWVMAASGIRPGEACGLMKSDLEGCILHVRRAIDVCHGSARIKSTKTGKDRKLILDETTVGIYMSRPSPYVFGGDGPARTDLMSKRWKRIACKAGVSFTPRSCRHFHATQLLGSGMSPRAVADRLGHSTPVITLSVYSQSIPAHDQVAADTIATVMPARHRKATLPSGHYSREDSPGHLQGDALRKDGEES